MTKVLPKPVDDAADSHGNTTGSAGHAARAAAGETGSGQLPFYLSIAALVLGAVGY